MIFTFIILFCILQSICDFIILTISLVILAHLTEIVRKYNIIR